MFNLISSQKLLVQNVQDFSSYIPLSLGPQSQQDGHLAVVMHRITYNRQWELLLAAIPFMALVMEDTSFVPLLQIKGALIHHLAYQILVYRFVSCYIGIGKFLSDFTDIRSIHR